MAWIRMALRRILRLYREGMRGVFTFESVNGISSVRGKWRCCIASDHYSIWQVVRTSIALCFVVTVLLM